MSTISLRTNIASLRAQTQVSRASSALSQSFERLSSGLRINRASDDAAGLAVADGLRTDAKVYGQAILNVNESISLLNVADAATNELSNILSRMLELATKGSNGTLTSAQRIALDDEGEALRQEYNRIVSTTEYNDQDLIDGTFGTTSTQAGYGVSGQISFTVGEELDRTAGDGTFTKDNEATVTSSSNLAQGDINGDGRIDLLAGSAANGEIYVLLGNGDGTFQSEITGTLGTLKFNSVELADLDGDNVLDAIGLQSGAVDIAIGNGDGTFDTAVTYATDTTTTEIATGDVDGDGDIDIVQTSSGADDSVSVFLNNGNGTFAARVSYGAGNDPNDVKLVDFDGDNDLDIVTANQTDNSISVLLNNGNGTFAADVTYATATRPEQVDVGDIDNDGDIDIVTFDDTDNVISVLQGNGDGTFQTSVSFTSDGSTLDIKLFDATGDGILDVVSMAAGYAGIQVGDGNGSFGTFTTQSFSGSVGGGGLVAADFNGDGVLDLATPDRNDGTAHILLGGTQQIQTLERLNLSSQSTAQAAVTTINAAIDRVTLERGEIGASLSRHSIASNLLFTQRDNYLEAESNIRDIDVAAESAQLVRSQIIQEAAVAVLSQANLQSNLALDLLSDI